MYLVSEAAEFSSDISHKMCPELSAAEFDSSFSEISRVQCGGRPPGPGQDTPYVDIYNEKPVRVATKVVVPTKQHPKVSNKQKSQLRKCCSELAQLATTNF